MKKLFYISLITIFSQLNAQSNISGQAFGFNNDSLMFANILLYQNDSIIIATTSDIEGYYYFDKIENGNYQIVLSYMGIKSDRVAIQVLSSDIIINLKITREPNYVICGGCWWRTINNFHFENLERKITKESIRETNLKDVSKIIEIHSSNTFDSKGNISFKGSRTDAVNYVLDGVNTQDKIEIPTPSIYSMKVYNGGIPARFGNTTGTIIDVRTKSYFDYFE